jgi:hypothetical protein
MTPTRKQKRCKRRLVNLGVIEFHSESYNPGLVKRFFDVTKDLTDSASIADLWLMDIASVLKEFGYEMKVWEITGRQSPVEIYRERQRKMGS